MSTPVLSTDNLTVGYRSGNKVTAVLSGLNLSLNAGQLVCLLGANGIGKSTLLRTLSGVQEPLTGTITVSGKDMCRCSTRELSKLISIVYTDRTLAGALTVQEVVSLGRHPYTGFLGRLGREDRLIVAEAIEAVGITSLSQKHIATLSDGERQKTMIARAIAQQTPIIILDEPTAFLDVASRIETMRLLHNLAGTQNKAILLSSHDIGQSLSLAHRLWLLRDDHSMTSGVTEDLILSNEIEHLFSNRDVTFDYNTGDFLAKPAITRHVSVSCDNRLLRHWLSNALLRNNIGIADNCDTTIYAGSNTDFSVISSTGSRLRAGSIAELLSILVS